MGSVGYESSEQKVEERSKNIGEGGLEKMLKGARGGEREVEEKLKQAREDEIELYWGCGVVDGI